MDKATLVGADIEASRRVIQKLESLGIVVDVAAWLQAPSGQDYAADELDLLYVVRSGGWPEKNPDWLVAATTAPGAVKANITFRRVRP